MALAPGTEIKKQTKFELQAKNVIILTSVNIMS